MLEALELSGTLVALGIGITAVAALLHGTIGFGFGLVSVSVLALIDPRLAPNPQLIIGLPLAVVMALREREAIDRRGLRFIFLGALPGTALGTWIVRVGDKRTLDMVIGGAVLLAVALLARGHTVRRSRGMLTAGGFASSAMGLISAIGGPPLALLYRDGGGPMMRATIAAFFAAGGLAAIGARAAVGALAWADLWRAVALVPGLAFGLWLSRYTMARAEGAPLRVGVLLVAAVAGGALVLRAAFTG